MSESFERAAYELKRAMENFGTGDFGFQVEQFGRAVGAFESSVNRLQTILGMQAENDQRKAVGASMAYTEDAFVKV
jgi:hypothetical protein